MALDEKKRLLDDNELETVDGGAAIDGGQKLVLHTCKFCGKPASYIYESSRYQNIYVCEDHRTARGVFPASP